MSREPVRPVVSLPGLLAMAGSFSRQSDWTVIDQAMIDEFAEMIDDHQFIHVDAERARQTPFGGTVAHGFLSLSVMGGLAGALVPALDSQTMSINYGFDRIRFVAPVRSGGRVRADVSLVDANVNDKGYVALTYACVLQVEGEDRPAIVADWLVRLYFSDP